MRAIDVHVHPSTRGLDCDACAYFRRELSEVPTTEEKFAELFVTHQVKALLIGWHPSTVKDGTQNSNEHVIDLVTKYPDAFAGVLASLNVGSQPVTELIQAGRGAIKKSGSQRLQIPPTGSKFLPER